MFIHRECNHFYNHSVLVRSSSKECVVHHDLMLNLILLGKPEFLHIILFVYLPILIIYRDDNAE